MIALRIAVALTLAVLPPAGATAALPMRILHITDSAPQTVATGTLIEVRLPATLGAGFSWSLKPLRCDVLKAGQQGSVRRGPNDPNLDGSPDVQYFRFLAAHAGRTTLEFEYRRPFDRTTPPSKTFRTTVTVKRP